MTSERTISRDCLRCGHHWRSRRGGDRPKCCPLCHSAYWDRPPKTARARRPENTIRVNRVIRSRIPKFNVLPPDPKLPGLPPPPSRLSQPDIAIPLPPPPRTSHRAEPEPQPEHIAAKAPKTIPVAEPETVAHESVVEMPAPAPDYAEAAAIGEEME